MDDTNASAETRESPCACCGRSLSAKRRYQEQENHESSGMERLKNFMLDEEKRHYVLVMTGGIALLVSFFGWRGAMPFDPVWITVVLCGVPILQEAVTGLVARFDVKTDVLVAIALIAAVVIGEIFAAGEVAFIMSLGALLEERTVRKAREGIEKLVNMTPRTARIVRDGAEDVIPAQDVRIGDIVRVLPGETIAVDGVITSGQTSIDQSLMTGESLPVDKEADDEVFSGTVNQFGAFDLRAVKVGEDSSLQRMIRLVESADASKTPIVRVMDRWATWIVGAALLTALGVWLVTGEVIRAVTILVVFCPCSLILSTPTAIMAGIGNATRHGILISSGDALERLARIDAVAFDKTGTLTHGKPEVVAIISLAPDISENTLLALASTAERRSEHPLGRALIRYAEKRGVSAADPEQFTMIPGRGVTVTSGGKRISGGSLQLMRDNGIPEPDGLAAQSLKHKKLGSTIIYIGLDNVLAGMIVLADTVRPDAQAMIARLHDERVKTVLLTGDHAEAANNIAAAVGIGEVRAELLPEGKVDFIAQVMQKDRREKVCMVGDGINDAPALKAAYVGLAMGGVGSDIAVDAADGVLVRDDIRFLPHLLRLAKKTLATIKVNISLSLLLNLVTVVLAAMGLMGPVVGALAHNAGALLIVLNSARLLGVKETTIRGNAG
jgi:heavy metal translocating P-type ATPase